MPLSRPTPSPAPTPLPRSYLQSVECRFQLPQGERIECWDLVVPESRQDSASADISLHVARIRSHGEAPQPDPVVLLAGGPGGYALDGLDYVISDFQDILADRDLIFYDQRGVGYSEPELDCPEWQAALADLLKRGLPWRDYRAREQEEMIHCASKLRAEGRDLAAYNTLESAADLEDLRIALGIDSWTLFGGSYGTRLALTAMREVPAGIRSAILDSVVPLQADPNATMGVNFQQALNLLFLRCEQDKLCGEAFPDLEKTFYETIADLDESPLQARFPDPLTGDLVEVMIDGDRLIELTGTALYNTDIIPLLPRILTGFNQGQVPRQAQPLIAVQLRGPAYASEGLFYSVTCSDEMPFSASQLMAFAGQPPSNVLQEHFETDFQALTAVCASWNVKPAPQVENQAVVSSIPILILAGDYDPVTPAVWAQLAAETLSNAYVAEFSGVGHGVFPTRQCARDIVNQFLRDPNGEPDLSCVDKSRPFFLKY
jgi:pimeloyl-ACP methyl ester carboxylesterase